jgi:hypothetical protein
VLVRQELCIRFYHQEITPLLKPTASERARIDSSGNLLVGKSASLNTTVGIENRPDGQIYATYVGLNICGFNT